MIFLFLNSVEMAVEVEDDGNRVMDLETERQNNRLYQPHYTF